MGLSIRFDSVVASVKLYKISVMKKSMSFRFKADGILHGPVNFFISFGPSEFDNHSSRVRIFEIKNRDFVIVVIKSISLRLDGSEEMSEVFKAIDLGAAFVDCFFEFFFEIVVE